MLAGATADGRLPTLDRSLGDSRAYTPGTHPGDRASLERFRTDPLALHRYPLGFLASLFTADLSGMTDGRIRCPVTVLAARGDPLFPTADARRLFERIQAPSKRFVELDLDRHLIFNECIPQVLPPVVTELDAFVAQEP